MAIDKGNIKTSANYDVKAQKPLDGRAVRPTKADLIKKESWSSDGSTVYVYEGMQVYVQDEKKTYYLKDLSKMLASDFSGWELMGTGATPEIDLSGYATQDDLAHKQDILMNGINIKTINGQNVLGRGNIEIEGGSGGITEEKEVYIGTEPTEEAKLWIDPTGTPSGGNEGGNASGGGASGGGAESEPIVFYIDITSSDIEDERKASNAISATTIINDFNQGVYHHDIVVVGLVNNVALICYHPLAYAAMGASVNLTISDHTSYKSEDGDTYCMAKNLVIDTNGNVTAQ